MELLGLYPHPLPQPPSRHLSPGIFLDKSHTNSVIGTLKITV